LEIEFTRDAAKARSNLAKHSVNFEDAKRAFSDPFLIIVEDCEVEGEIRYQAIGRGESGPLLLTVFADRSRDDVSSPPGRQTNMSKERTPISSRKGIRISDETRHLYARLDPRAKGTARSLPPERWATAMRREEFFKPLKKQTTVRIDADVLDWLRSQGDGHLTRINQILRDRMTAERHK